jgi:hypothetical protein
MSTCENEMTFRIQIEFLKTSFTFSLWFLVECSERSLLTPIEEIVGPRAVSYIGSYRSSTIFLKIVYGTENNINTISTLRTLYQH